MRFTDPSGHFSPEQLGALGIYQDQVSEDIWNVLLLLEPGDIIADANNQLIGQVVIGYGPNPAGLTMPPLALYLQLPNGGYGTITYGLYGYTTNSVIIWRPFQGELVDNDLDGPYSTPDGAVISLYEVWRLGHPSSLMSRRQQQGYRKIIPGFVFAVEQGPAEAYEDAIDFPGSIANFFNRWFGKGQPDAKGMVGDIVLIFTYDLGGRKSVTREFVYRPGQNPPQISNGILYCTGNPLNDWVNEC